MKILFLLMSFSSLSFSQNENSKNLMTNNAPCTFEMTVDQLTSDKLNFNCPEVFQDKAFKIQNFKIKFIGYASIIISGNSLNFRSKKIAESLKVGDYVTIIEIEDIIIGKKVSQNYQTLIIKIIQ